MSKVLVDRELLSRAADLLGWDEIAEQLRAFIAQPAEAEGVEVVGYVNPSDLARKLPNFDVKSEKRAHYYEPVMLVSDHLATLSAPAQDEVQTVIRNLRCIAKTVLSSEARSSMRADLESAIRLLATRPAQTAARSAECTNEDSWNCKYCRKTETCEAIKDPRNFAAEPIKEQS